MQVIFNDPSTRIIDSIVRSIPVPMSTHEEFKEKLDQIHDALGSNQKGIERIQTLTTSLQPLLPKTTEIGSFEKNITALTELSELIASASEQRGRPPVANYNDESFWLAARHHDLCATISSCISEDTNNIRFEHLVQHLSKELIAHANLLSVNKQDCADDQLQNCSVHHDRTLENNDRSAAAGKSRRSLREFLSENPDKILLGTIAGCATLLVGLCLNEILPWAVQETRALFDHTDLANSISQASNQNSNHFGTTALSLLSLLTAPFLARKLGIKSPLSKYFANRSTKLFSFRQRGLNTGGKMPTVHGGRLETERTDLQSLLFTTCYESPNSRGQTNRIKATFATDTVPPFASMPERTATEIDALFDVISFVPFASKELPVDLGFEISAYEGPGKLQKSDLGTYLVSGIPPGKHTFKYRLTPRNEPITISKEKAAEWLDTPEREKYHPATYRAIYLAKLAPTPEEGIAILIDGLKAAGATYSTDPTMLSLIKGKHAIEIADMLQIYLCDTISYSFAHNARMAGIPTCTIGGLQAKKTPKGYQFLISPGHQINLYVNKDNHVIQIEPQAGVIHSGGDKKPFKFGAKVRLQIKKNFFGRNSYVKLADLANEWRNALYAGDNESRKETQSIQQHHGKHLSGAFSYSLLSALDKRLSNNGRITSNLEEAKGILESLPFVSPYAARDKELFTSKKVLDSRINYQAIKKIFVKDLRTIVHEQPAEERASLLKKQVSQFQNEQSYIGEWLDHSLLAVEAISLVLEDTNTIKLKPHLIIKLLEKSLREISTFTHSTSKSRGEHGREIDTLCSLLERYGATIQSRKLKATLDAQILTIMDRSLRLVSASILADDHENATYAAEVLKRLENISYSVTPKNTHSVTKKHLQHLLFFHYFQEIPSADHIKAYARFVGQHGCFNTILKNDGSFTNTSTELLSEILYTDKVKIAPSKLKNRSYFPSNILIVAKHAGMDITPILDPLNPALKAYLDTFYFNPSKACTKFGAPGGVLIQSPTGEERAQYPAKEFLCYDSGQQTNAEFFLFREQIAFGNALYAVKDEAHNLIKQLADHRANEAESYALSLLEKHAHAKRSTYHSSLLVSQSQPKDRKAPWLSLPAIPSQSNHRGTMETDNLDFLTNILGLSPELSLSWLQLKEKYPLLAQKIGHKGSSFSNEITRDLQDFRIQTAMKDRLDQLSLLLKTVFTATDTFNQIDSRLSEVEHASKLAQRILLGGQEITAEAVDNILNESFKDSTTNWAIQKVLSPLSPQLQMQSLLYLGWLVHNNMDGFALTYGGDANAPGAIEQINPALSSIGNLTHKDTFKTAPGTLFPISIVMSQLTSDIDLEILQERSENFSNAISLRAQRFDKFSARYLKGSLKHVGSGMLFDELREYRQGDDIRQVDWKASARKGKLISKEMYDEEPTWSKVFADLGWLKENVSPNEIGKNIPLLMELLQSATQSAHPISLVITVFGEPLLTVESAEIMRIMHERGTNDAIRGKSDLLCTIWRHCINAQNTDLQSTFGNMIIPSNTRLHAYETPILLCSRKSVEATRHFTSRISGQKGFQSLQQ